MNNLYQLYQYNVWNLINNYNLKYCWLNISEEKFYNGIKGQDPSNWETLLNNPWLNIYKNNKLNLAKDILKNGMFTPIFYQTINNKKYIVIGKHRLYSLLLFNSITPITKKFLFIELPNKLNDIKLENNQELYFFYDEYRVSTINIKSLKDLIYYLIDIGDNLTSYLWNYKCKPSAVFNNEQAFNTWLNNSYNFNIKV